MKTPVDNLLDTIGGQLDQLFQPAAVEQDLKKSVQAIIQSAIERLNLVSREEFDAQTAVLAKTRAKLDELEARLQQENR